MIILNITIVQNWPVVNLRRPDDHATISNRLRSKSATKPQQRQIKNQQLMAAKTGKNGYGAAVGTGDAAGAAVSVMGVAALSVGSGGTVSKRGRSGGDRGGQGANASPRSY